MRKLTKKNTKKLGGQLRDRPMQGNLAVSKQLRSAIDASELSRYAIWKATDISEAQLSRFMSGNSGLSMESIDILCRLLGLELQPVKRRKTKGR